MLRTFIYRFTYRLFKESVGAYAAQITFYMIMSLVPLITLVGMMLTRTNLITADGVIALIQNYHSIPEAAMDVIVSVFDNLDRGTTGSYVLYVIIILYAASRSVRGIMNGIHMAYQTVETRPLLLIFLISFFYTIVFAFSSVPPGDARWLSQRSFARSFSPAFAGLTPTRTIGPYMNAANFPSECGSASRRSDMGSSSSSESPSRHSLSIAT